MICDMGSVGTAYVFIRIFPQRKMKRFTNLTAIAFAVVCYGNFSTLPFLGWKGGNKKV